MPTRKAILIGSPGPVTNRLPGVSTDLDRFRSFLISEQGGYWYENEIELLEDPSYRKFQRTLVSSNPDYLLIYFSGHGGQFKDHKYPFVHFRDAHITDIKLLHPDCKKQILITDSCRTYFPRILGIPSGPEFEQISHFTGPVSRHLLDQAISSSPDGISIIRSCSAGEESIDLDGGVYTTSFLESIINLSTSLKDNSPIIIERAMIMTKAIMKQKNISQIPSVSALTGDLQIPIGYAVTPTFSQQLSKRHLPAKPKSIESHAVAHCQDISFEKLALGVGVLLLMMAVFNGSD